mgnify:CR=1 FL=1
MMTAVSALAACSLTHEDEDLTNCGLFVTFKYDYNLQRSDMFGDHVGAVTLYVFDNDGNYVKSYDSRVSDLKMMPFDGKYLHTMQVTDLPDGKYRLIALASQKDYAETLATTGAKYRRTDMNAGDPNDRLTVTLDRTSSPSALSTVPATAPLDTLWHGMTGTLPVEVVGSDKTVANISMTRDTKMLTIGLHNLDDPMDITTDEFDIFIVDNNGTIGYNNALLPDEDIVYTPFHRWDSFASDDQGQPTYKTAHACLTFNRLVWHEQSDENALLVIRNHNTGLDVAAINLTDFLAQGRNAYDVYAYSRQEYLDRSYDYYMDFFIRNNKWQYAEVRINVLSWAHRIQNVDLK